MLQRLNKAGKTTYYPSEYCNGNTVCVKCIYTLKYAYSSDVGLK
jgi:hypothetical protein